MRVFKSLMLKYVVFALMLLTGISLFAAKLEGETLERQAWKKHIRNHQWDDLETLRSYFQLVVLDVILNKEQYMNHVKTLNISNFVLDDFKVTEGPDIKVVTYDIAVSETIEGKSLTSKANRLTVWQKNNDNWQMIAHAVLIPLPLRQTQTSLRRDLWNLLIFPI